MRREKSWFSWRRKPTCLRALRFPERTLHALFPRRCIFCGGTLSIENKALFCGDCGVIPSGGAACPRCAHPADSSGECPACDVNPVLFHEARSLWVYEDAARRFVREYKFKARPRLAFTLAHRLLARHGDYIRSFGALLPVPPSAAGRFERGFCPVDRMAVLLQRAAGVPVLRIFRRTDGGWSQHLADRRERKRAGRVRFRLIRGASPPSSVLLLDDVLTTGATLNELTAALADLGVPRIGVLTAARTKIAGTVEN